MTSLAVIIPLFNEDEHFSASFEIIRKHALSTQLDCKFVLIDDCSTDSTWNVIESLANKHQKILGIKLARNFGKESALCAGLEAAPGFDYYLTIDADLQHPPELISEMWKMLTEEKADIVEGIKLNGEGKGLLHFAMKKIFYAVLNKYSQFNFENETDFKLFSKEVYSSWLSLQETNTFFRGMTKWIGFSTKKINFLVPKREFGVTKWESAKLFRLGINALTSYTSAPLHIVSVLGSVFILFAFIVGVHTLYVRFFEASSIGFATVILLLLITGGTIMISLGIIGEYIARIYDEVKRRPRYILKDRIEKD